MLYLVKHTGGQIQGTTSHDFWGHSGRWYFSTAEGEPIRRWRGHGASTKTTVFFSTKASAVRAAKKAGWKVSSVNSGNKQHPAYQIEHVGNVGRV